MTVLISILFLGLLIVGLATGEDGLTAAALVAWPLGLLLARFARRLDALERTVARLQAGAGAVTARRGPAAAERDAADWDSRDWDSPDQLEHPPASAARPRGPLNRADAGSGAASAVPGDVPLARPGPEPVSGPALDRPAAPALASAVRRFLTEGNPVARIGILVLFIGVAFLLKYAAEHSLLPLGVRLGAVAAGGLGLLALGWRLRGRARLYALLLQGAGIGVVFLSAFAAARLFGVLGPVPALLVMVVLVAVTGVLAVRQDAPGLAAFGVAGGFLAPVLVSTGGGSHVALFAFYAVLNLGILGIAWFASWKGLNLEGLLFTFGLGALWGARFYRPEHFATVEPFLLFNFALYLAVAVLFATRQPPRLRGLVDSTLVFGLPLAVFALQGALVADREYGLAWSALGIGLTYLGLAAVLRLRARPGLELLTEAFLALGVAFLTAAIPLALDGRLSSALWAAEGAGLVWIGVRQVRVLARTAGWLLQLAAGWLFLDVAWSRAEVVPVLPVLDGDTLGYLVLALSGLFSSRCLEGATGRLRPVECGLAWWFLVWGGGWWLAGGVHVTDLLHGWQPGFARFLAFLAASGLAAGLLAPVLRWPGLARAGTALLPLLWLLGLWALVDHAHPFAGWMGPAWAAALGVAWWLLYGYGDAGPDGVRSGHARPDDVRPGDVRGAGWPPALTRLWHGATLWLAVLLVGADLSWWGGHLLSGGAWPWAGWALPALLVMALLVFAGPRLPWPVRAWPEDDRGRHLVPIAAALWVWTLAAALTPADPAPLPFVPLLNPVELMQAAVLVLLARWTLTAPAAGWGLMPWVGLAGLVALTGAVAHGVHHLAGVPFSTAHLFRSTLFQAALSLCWGLAALAAMWAGARGGRRALWIGGALLIGLVLVKLFLVDLSGSGSVARIVSFIGVGGLMLVIGYLAPLPPRGGTSVGTPTGNRQD